MNEREKLQEQFLEHIQLGQTPEVMAILRAHPDAINWGTQDTDRRRTALHLAAIHVQCDIAQALIDAGADMEAQDNFGETPLGWAALRKNRVPMVELLLKAGADPNGRLKNGATPLMRAAAEESNVAAQLLVRAGANINARDDGGTTALKVAVSKSDAIMIGLLVRLGADVSGVADAATGNIRAVIDFNLARKQEEESLIQTQIKEGCDAPVAVRKPLKLKAKTLRP